MQETLLDLFKLCGPKKVVLARELTKHFETFHRGFLGQDLEPALVEKGEFVIIVEAGSSSPEGIIPEEVFQKSVMGNKAMAKKIATEYGISVKQAYQKLLES